MPTLTARIALTCACSAAPGGAIRAATATRARAELREARALFEGGECWWPMPLCGGAAEARPAKMLLRRAGAVRFRAARPALCAQRLGLARAWALACRTRRRTRPHCPASPRLLQIAGRMNAETRAALAPLVGTLERAGWRWGAAAEGGCRRSARRARPSPDWKPGAACRNGKTKRRVGQPGSQTVEPEEAPRGLLRLVGRMRPEQAAYSDAATYAFGPREEAGAPKVALIEAGTGTGKTLGYLAPASVWAEKNGPGLWISTYTRNLQRQIVQEIAHLYPDPAERAEKAVVRKGRENYLCLLNFEEAAKRTALAPGQRSVALGLIARWIASGTDGDISGAGFPAFLAARCRSPPSPTGAANASMPPARITASASSSAPSAGPAMRPSWSPTMPW